MSAAWPSFTAAWNSPSAATIFARRSRSASGLLCHCALHVVEKYNVFDLDRRYLRTPRLRVPVDDVLDLLVDAHLLGCCPLAASGHAAVTAPTNVMNSRRRMACLGLGDPNQNRKLRVSWPATDRRSVPILLQKSFCTDDNSPDYRRDFRVKMWGGTSSPDEKLTSDLGSVIEATRIGVRCSDRRNRAPHLTGSAEGWGPSAVTAGKLSPGNFGLLQQYLPIRDID
jgi:hypothetical protein